MEHWLSEYTARAPGYGLEQLCGRKYWKSIFGACVPDPELDRRFHVSPFQAFCLYGPEEMANGLWPWPWQEILAGRVTVSSGFPRKT